MLKRKYRLKVGRLTNPKNYSLPFFNAKVSDNGLSFSRISFIISKKVDKRATARNKIKRRLSETVEKSLESVRGKDILFYPKKEVLERKPEEVKKETEDFLKKI